MRSSLEKIITIGALTSSLMNPIISKAADVTLINGASQTPYTSVQEAYNNASDGNTIRQDVPTLAGTPNFNRNITVYLSPKDSQSTASIDGKMTISNGKVIVKDGKISIGQNIPASAYTLSVNNPILYATSNDLTGTISNILDPDKGSTAYVSIICDGETVATGNTSATYTGPFANGQSCTINGNVDGILKSINVNVENSAPYLITSNVFLPRYNTESFPIIDPDSDLVSCIGSIPGITVFSDCRYTLESQNTCTNGNIILSGDLTITDGTSTPSYSVSIDVICQ